MDNYYRKMTQDEENKHYQRYASIKMEENRNGVDEKNRREDSEVIIDETTIYEIDLDCYECIKKRMKGNKNNL